MSYFAKTQIKDQYGFAAECTPMDELRIAESYRLVGSTFVGTTLDTNFWTAIPYASGGTIATADLTTMPGALTISSKTDATGSMAVQSARYARYVGGNSNRYRAQVQFGDTGKTDNTKRWGMFDGTNGAYFKLAGTTLSVCTMKASSETAVASASWNGSTATPTLTNVNTYEIYITNSKVYFVIAGTLVHTVSATTATWTATTTLPVRVDNINSGNTTDTTITIRVMTIYRLGPLETLPTYKHIAGAATTVCKLGAGNLHRIVVNQAGTLCTITDGAATIGIIDTNKTTGVIGAIEYHLPFSTGLTLVTTGAGTDLTVVYE